MMPSRVPRYFVGLFLAPSAASSDSRPLDIEMEITSAGACLCTVLSMSHFDTFSTVSGFIFLFKVDFLRLLEANNMVGRHQKRALGASCLGSTRPQYDNMYHPSLFNTPCHWLHRRWSQSNSLQFSKHLWKKDQNMVERTPHSASI